MTHVFLIGMPGAGKTWWGSRVAALLNMAFTDLDEQLMYRNRDTIPAMFEKFGEAGFRQREHDLLQLLIANLTTPTLIACGGGTPCFHDNMRILKAAGSVIYLQCGIDILLDHLGSGSERPLLPVADRRQKLEQLLAARAAVYEQADLTIDVNQLELSTFEQSIRSCIKRQSS